MLSENPRAGRESLTNLPPHGKFWPSHHSPARPPRLSPSLAPILEFLYIYDACGIWKTTDKATQGHLSNHLEGRTKLSKVSCLANNLLLLGVEHFFKEWVCWLLPKEEGRLILSYKYSLPDICLLEYLMIKVTTRYFSTWFDPSRTLTNNKGSTTQRHRQDENLTILDRVHILIRSRSRIQWAGFSREGHGTQMQQMHGHSKPQVFSGGHVDPAQP